MAAGGQEVAHGRIVIDLDDRATRDLERIDREFHRTMEDIEREHATVDLDADVDGLKKDLKEAEKAVKDYQKKVDSADNNYQKAARKRQLEKLKLLEEEKRAAVAAAAERKRQNQEETKQLRVTRRELDAITKREEARDRAFQQAHARRMQAIQQESRRRKALFDQKQREFSADERQARTMERARERELAAIPKLQRSYAELESRLVKLGAARRKARGDRQAIQIIDLKETETVADMHRLHSRLKSIGAEPISIHVDLERGARSGRFIHDAFQKGGFRHAVNAASIATGVSIGSGITRGIQPHLQSWHRQRRCSGWVSWLQSPRRRARRLDQHDGAHRPVHGDAAPACRGDVAVRSDPR